MASPLRAADDASLSVLDDRGVFFCGSAQEIHLFNAPATFLWCALEQGLGRDELVQAFADAFGVSRSEAERSVARALSEWSARGYLREGSGRETAQRPAARSRPPRLAALPTEPRQRRFVRSATIALLETRFRLDLQSARQEALVWPAVAHLATHDAGAPHVTLQVVLSGDEHVLRLDGGERLRCADPAALAPAIQSALWQAAVNRHRYLMEIHAGVVSDGRACTLLPAPPGRGKTTLTAALVRNGYRYLSDESALLDRRTLRARALPLAMAVKGGAVAALRALYPGIDRLPVHQRADGVRVRYLPPPASACATSVDKALPVDRLVFPSYVPEGPNRLRLISRPEALGRLLEQCVVLPNRLDVRDVRELVQWMRGLGCFELAFSSLDRAIELLG